MTNRVYCFFSAVQGRSDALLAKDGEAVSMVQKGEWSLMAVEYVVARNTCRQGENCTNKTLRLTLPDSTFRTANRA